MCYYNYHLTHYCNQIKLNGEIWMLHICSLQCHNYSIKTFKNRHCILLWSANITYTNMNHKLTVENIFSQWIYSFWLCLRYLQDRSTVHKCKAKYFAFLPGTKLNCKTNCCSTEHYPLPRLELARRHLADKHQAGWSKYKKYHSQSEPN